MFPNHLIQIEEILKKKMKYWNSIYNKNKHLSQWPWSEVVSICNRYCRKQINNKSKKILELGFGAGANIPFFLSKPIKYYGVEGSKVIFLKVKKKYKKIKKNLFNRNFSEKIFKNMKFDLILDRASVTHNNKENIVKIIEEAKNILNKGGLYIGIDWYSQNCSDFTKKNNSNNYLFLKSGIFKNIGGVYFSSKKDILKFFEDFKILYLSEKNIVSHKEKKTYNISSWTIVAKKK